MESVTCLRGEEFAREKIEYKKLASRKPHLPLLQIKFLTKKLITLISSLII